MNALDANDPAVKLAELARRSKWGVTELWNMYENAKHKFPKDQQQEMYRVTARACAILVGSL